MITMAGTVLMSRLLLGRLSLHAKIPNYSSRICFECPTSRKVVSLPSHRLSVREFLGLAQKAAGYYRSNLTTFTSKLARGLKLTSVK
jgi:hypothetical protein